MQRPSLAVSYRFLRFPRENEAGIAHVSVSVRLAALGKVR
jgi:hypothetical protein